MGWGFDLSLFGCSRLAHVELGRFPAETSPTKIQIQPHPPDPRVRSKLTSFPRGTHSEQPPPPRSQAFTVVSIIAILFPDFPPTSPTCVAMCGTYGIVGGDIHPPPPPRRRVCGKVAEAQRAKRAERESLTTDSRMRGRPKSEEPKPKSKPMGAPRQLLEEEKARRQERQVQQ